MKNIFVAVQVDYTGDIGPISGKPINGGNQALYAFTEVYRAGTNLVSALEMKGIPRKWHLCFLTPGFYRGRKNDKTVYCVAHAGRL